VDRGYFPRGQQAFRQIAEKVAQDAAGVERNDATGLAFVTNQELTLGERDQLAESGARPALDVYHLERIASILDSPLCYGLRLEFLDIEMNKEEQISFIASRDAALAEMKDAMDAMAARLSEHLEQREAPSRDIPTVTPLDVGSPYSASSFFQPEYVECRDCGDLPGRTQKWSRF